MRLNHLNLTVTDVGAARDFLERYFEMKCEFTRGDSFAALVDDGGTFVTLMRGREASYPGTFHVGFAQESEKRVDEVNRRLREDGFDVKPPGEFHGSWTFYIQAPGGFTVEVLGPYRQEAAVGS